MDQVGHPRPEESGQLQPPRGVPPVATGLMTPGGFGGGPFPVRPIMTTAAFLVCAGIVAAAVAATSWFLRPAVAVPAVTAGTLAFLLGSGRTELRPVSLTTFIAVAAAGAIGIVFGGRAPSVIGVVLDVLYDLTVAALFTGLTLVRWAWSVGRTWPRPSEAAV